VTAKRKVSKMAPAIEADKIPFDELRRLMCEAPAPQAEVR
jgi:hypothetical protein